MKAIINKSFIYFLIASAIGFTSCEKSSDDVIEDNSIVELTIQEKVSILEGDEWLLKGFETNVMETFVAGEIRTHYGEDNVFGEHIPGTKDYTITEDLLTVDYHFGNVFTYELKFSCDNNIVEFYKEGELNRTLYRRNSNYQDCL